MRWLRGTELCRLADQRDGCPGGGAGRARRGAGQLATGSPALATPAAAGNHPQWWDETTAYQHSIVIGNDGRVDRYLTQTR